MCFMFWPVQLLWSSNFIEINNVSSQIAVHTHTIIPYPSRPLKHYQRGSNHIRKCSKHLLWLIESRWGLKRMWWTANCVDLSMRIISLHHWSRPEVEAHFGQKWLSQTLYKISPFDRSYIYSYKEWSEWFMTYAVVWTASFGKLLMHGGPSLWIILFLTFGIRVSEFSKVSPSWVKLHRFSKRFWCGR